MEIPIKMDDLGVPPFSETPIRIPEKQSIYVNVAAIIFPRTSRELDPPVKAVVK